MRLVELIVVSGPAKIIYSDAAIVQKILTRCKSPSLRFQQPEFDLNIGIPLRIRLSCKFRIDASISASHFPVHMNRSHADDELIDHYEFIQLSSAILLKVSCPRQQVRAAIRRVVPPGVSGATDVERFGAVIFIPLAFVTAAAAAATAAAAFAATCR